MYLIGLTGGIASGKSTVSNYLKELGAKIIDGDIIAREVVVPEKPAWIEIVKAFGEKILLPDRNLNRAVLGEIIFNDEKAKKILEKIISPYIANEIYAKINLFNKEQIGFVILDLPLLYENNWDRETNENWVVYVDEKTQIERLCKLNNYTIQQALSRINNQMSLKEKATRADFVIDNNSDIESTKRQVLDKWQELQIKIKECE